MEDEEEGAAAPGGSVPVAAWLGALHLEQYAERFERRGLRRVGECRALTDEALGALGVRLPGHRRRILLGLQKAFADPQPPAGTPPGKPVPLKRHIFRPAVTPERLGTPPVAQRGGSVTQLPPPIPPRVGCQPPVKFSVSLRGGSPEPPREPPPAPGVPPLAEMGVRAPPLPPLPAKRHQLEAKGQSPETPPAAAPPPLLPPRAVPHRR